jgi:hypothetical protein
MFQVLVTIWLQTYQHVKAMNNSDISENIRYINISLKLLSDGEALVFMPELIPYVDPQYDIMKQRLLQHHGMPFYQADPDPFSLSL